MTLWEEHIQVCKRNIDSGQDSCWIFEIGKVYRKENNKLNETNVLSGLFTGVRTIDSWSKVAKKNILDYYSARGLLEKSLRYLKIDTEDRMCSSKAFLHPGKSSYIYVEGREIGIFGQIHPKIASELNIDLNTFIFELTLENLLKAATRSNKWIPIYKDYPTVPSMERDISIWIARGSQTNDLIKSIKKVGKSILEDVELIDIYENDKEMLNKRSLTFRLKYRKSESTLTDKEINPIHSKIINVLKETHEAEIRA